MHRVRQLRHRLQFWGEGHAHHQLSSHREAAWRAHGHWRYGVSGGGLWQPMGDCWHPHLPAPAAPKMGGDEQRLDHPEQLRRTGQSVFPYPRSQNCGLGRHVWHGRNFAALEVEARQEPAVLFNKIGGKLLGQRRLSRLLLRAGREASQRNRLGEYARPGVDSRPYDYRDSGAGTPHDWFKVHPPGRRGPLGNRADLA